MHTCNSASEKDNSSRSRRLPADVAATADDDDSLSLRWRSCRTSSAAAILDCLKKRCRRRCASVNSSNDDSDEADDATMSRCANSSMGEMSK